MDYRISKEYVWAGAIPDETAALATKLQALHEGGLNLEMILARRDWSGSGMLFVSPLRTVEEIEVAEKAGLAMSDSFMALRVEGPNESGLGAKMTSALAAAGLSLRGFSAMAWGDESVTTIAFDSREDVERGKEILEQTLAS